MIKKEDKPEFIGQIMDLFEDFLDEYGIKIPQKEGEESYDPDTPVNLCGKAYDDLAEQLEGFFRSWGVIKDERPQVEYLFILSLNGIKCEGTISVKAKDSLIIIKSAPTDFPVLYKSIKNDLDIRNF